MQRNVLAMSGRAVEAAGDIDVLLLDKTGTITYGLRMAAEFIPVHGRRSTELNVAALRSSWRTDPGRQVDRRCWPELVGARALKLRIRTAPSSCPSPPKRA